jgi:hypothetical protein
MKTTHGDYEEKPCIQEDMKKPERKIKYTRFSKVLTLPLHGNIKSTYVFINSNGQIPVDRNEFVDEDDRENYYIDLFDNNMVFSYPWVNDKPPKELIEFYIMFDHNVLDDEFFEKRMQEKIMHDNEFARS